MISREGDNLAFILTVPRSGSTLLSVLLGGHSAVLCPPEPWFLLKLATLAEPVHAAGAFNEEMAGIATREFLPASVLHDAARTFATTAYNAHLAAEGKRVFVDKTPRYFHILPFLDAVFPRARKIWLQRDPLDVAASVKTSAGVGVAHMTGKPVRPVSLDFAKGFAALAVYFDAPSPLKFELQYEALAQAPAEHVEQVCAFLGLPPECESMLAFGDNADLMARHADAAMGDRKILETAAPHTESIGKWREALSPEETAQLLRVLGVEIFQRMGYGATVDTVRAAGIGLPDESAAARERERICTTQQETYAELRAQVRAYEQNQPWPRRLGRRIGKRLRKAQFRPGGGSGGA